MNLLIVGTDKSEIIEHLPDTFLFIDDGPLLEKIPPQKQRGTHLDLSKDAFNPLKDISYKRARDFISVLDAVFPEGESTLTKKASNFVLLKALLAHPKRLDKLIPHTRTQDPGVLDAYQKIQTLLLSPVLEKFLCNATNIPLDGILIAQLDRTVLSEFDCFVIANLLISNYPGQVVVPDFGFYGCKFHTALIRQKRLIAGVNFLDESPLRNNLLLIEEKRARHCTADDAETLAGFTGKLPGTNEYNDFIQASVA
jgi:hypothetical protein